MRFSLGGVLLAAAVALAGCGGGGGTTSVPESGTCPPENFSADSVTYPAAGVSHVLRADVGVPFDSGLPAVPDLEASCRARLGFRTRTGTDLPAGLQLDAATGRISGTALAAGFHNPQIEITVDGVASYTPPQLWITVADPSLYTISGWTAKELPPSGAGGFLSASDSRLLLTKTGDAGVTLASVDRGTSWSQLASGAPTPARAFCASADDGHSVYMSGGSEPVNDVWQFDGMAWRLRTASAPYPPRASHAMAKLNGALYVIGGQYPFGHTPTRYGDVWKSMDDGATWQQSAVPFPGQPVTCATVFQGRLAVLVGNVIWSSGDGTSWVQQPYVASSPLMAVTFFGGKGCTVANGRLYVVGGQLVASTVDLVQWQFEPSLPGLSVLDVAGPGLAVVGGRMYVPVTPWQAGVPSRLFESAP